MTKEQIKNTDIIVITNKHEIIHHNEKKPNQIIIFLKDHHYTGAVHFLD
jgi:hypothetical protein